MSGTGRSLNMDDRNLSTMGYGESKPIESNNTIAGRARNPTRGACMRGDAVSGAKREAHEIRPAAVRCAL
jgi:hypothetical protein